MGLFAVAMILLFVTIAVPAVGRASDFRSGNSIDVASSARIEGDIYFASRTLTFDGQTTGDATVAATRARIRGQIGGSLTMLVANGTVSGKVNGSARIVGGSVTVSGDIAGDLVIAGGQVDLSQLANVAGDVIIAGGSLDMRGTVNGNIRGIGMSTRISGIVGGDVNLETSQLAIDNAARITGRLTYSSAVDGDIGGSARVGDVNRTGNAPWTSGNDSASLFGPLLRIVWALIVGVLFVTVAPRAASTIAHHGGHILQAIGVGLLAVIVVPVVVAVLFLSVVGFSAGAIGLTIFLVIVYLSQVFAGLSLGRLILPRRWNDGSRGFHLLAMVLGILIVAAANYLPVPSAGLVVTAFITIWGLGAAFMMLADLTPRPTSERVI